MNGERWLGDFLQHRQHPDPAAFLVISRRPTAEHRQFRWTGGAKDVHLATLRSSVVEWLTSDEPAAVPDPLLLVVTELLTNARDASKPNDEITLLATVVKDDEHLAAVEVVVSNTTDRATPTANMPDPSSARGRGLAIVERMASSLDITTDDGIIVVTAVVAV